MFTQQLPTRFREVPNLGWLARNNNDCAYRHIVMDGTGVAIEIDAASGLLAFYDLAIFNSDLNFGAQIAQFYGCVLSGLNASFLVDNSISLFGGYLYPGRAGFNIAVWEGRLVRSCSLFGVLDSRSKCDI
jgi:hypothetical protein